MMKLIVRKAKTTTGRDRSQWYYALIGTNGEPMMASEIVHNKSDAIESVQSIAQNMHAVEIDVEDSP